MTLECQLIRSITSQVIFIEVISFHRDHRINYFRKLVTPDMFKIIATDCIDVLLVGKLRENQTCATIYSI